MVALFESNVPRVDRLFSQPVGLRVSDLLCMSSLSHASLTKEHDNNDDIQRSFR